MPLYAYIIYYARLIVRHPRRDILIRCTIEPLAGHVGDAKGVSILSCIIDVIYEY